MTSDEGRRNTLHATRYKVFPDTAVILAGGLGTRLKPIIAGKPKVLAPVQGRPFLDYSLSYLAAQGLKYGILSVGHLAGQVKSFAGDGRRWGLKVRCIEEQSPLGTGGALRLASQALNRPFFGLNGDTLFLADLRSLWKAHRAAGRLATIALLPVRDSRGRGCVNLAEGDLVVSFDEKPPSGQLEGSRTGALINAGVYVLEPEALAWIQPGEPASMEIDVFPRLAQERQLTGQVQEGYFADIGTPDSLAAFERDVAAGMVPNINF